MFDCYNFYKTLKNIPLALSRTLKLISSYLIRVIPATLRLLQKGFHINLKSDHKNAKTTDIRIENSFKNKPQNIATVKQIYEPELTIISKKNLLSQMTQILSRLYY